MHCANRIMVNNLPENIDTLKVTEMCENMLMVTTETNVRNLQYTLIKLTRLVMRNR